MFRKLLVILLLCVFAPLAWAGAVDINTATISELDALPGIGPAKAQAIVDHRKQNGAFVNIVQIMDVAGIGPATFENIRNLIETGKGGEAATPADPAALAVPADAADPAAEGSKAPVEATRDAGGPPTTTLNINVATAAELQTLPGVGPSKAQAIVDDRANNGPFEKCADLARVAGIGPATVANIEANCTTK